MGGGLWISWGEVGILWGCGVGYVKGFGKIPILGEKLEFWDVRWGGFCVRGKF